MAIPWKTIASVGATVVMTVATTLLNRKAQSDQIEKIGQEVGDKVIKSITNVEA